MKESTKFALEVIELIKQDMKTSKANFAVQAECLLEAYKALEYTLEQDTDEQQAA